MKKKILIIALLLSSIFVSGQEDNTHLEAPLGLRIKRNGQDVLVYADQGLSPDFSDYRKLNYQVYFRKIDYPTHSEKGINYQLISIPGSSKIQKQEYKKDGELIEDPRSGRTINNEDYDLNFWIDEDLIENNTNTEYYKYANDVFSGLLTAPFKYRLKLGNAPESFIDGDFNIAPFIGWKWRVSSSRPFYVAPFGFAGVTTLGFNSANNTKVIDAEKLENGAGLTYGLGLSFRFGSVSPGFIVGWDKGFGDLGSGFLYNDKAWISFSVNYDFFKPEKTSEAQK